MYSSNTGRNSTIKPPRDNSYELWTKRRIISFTGGSGERLKRRKRLEESRNAEKKEEAAGVMCKHIKAHKPVLNPEEKLEAKEFVPYNPICIKHRRQRPV